jgi:hypothetical protein
LADFAAREGIAIPGGVEAAPAPVSAAAATQAGKTMGPSQTA